MTAVAPLHPAQAFALVRRFCQCPHPQGAGGDACDWCGEPLPLTRWTVARLAELRRLMRQHGSVKTAAQALGERPQDCNLALNALMGRTTIHALAVLEARAER